MVMKFKLIIDGSIGAPENGKDSVGRLNERNIFFRERMEKIPKISPKQQKVLGLFIINQVNQL